MPGQFPAQPGLADTGATVVDKNEWLGSWRLFDHGTDRGDELLTPDKLPLRGRPFAGLPLCGIVRHALALRTFVADRLDAGGKLLRLGGAAGLLADLG